MESRYIPITQQPYCCVPACIQMVMCKNGIPLQSQEAIGYDLGLTVPQESAHLFDKAHTEKPASGLWGTQIGEPKYEINAALKRLSIPVAVTIKHIDKISSPESLLELLNNVEAKNGDALLCFKYGVLWDTDSTSGHVCVFDKIVDGKVVLVDPGQQVPKLRLVDPEKLYKSMVEHEKAVFPGVWVFERTDS